jgi:hypothetical protein
MFKKSIFFLISIFLISNIFTISYINEIDFLEDNFVEIYSDTFLNLTNSNISDEGKTQNLILKKENLSSNFYLIISNEFENKYDLNNFKCNIYSVNENNIGSYGLKNSGENITIKINSTFNLSFENSFSFSLNENESLNFNNLTNSFYSNLTNPCSINIHNTTFSNSNSLNEISFGLNFLNEKSYGVFENSLQFQFETNTKQNYIITYWIEGVYNGLVKPKKNSTNTNIKRHSPSSKENFIDILTIYGELYINNSLNKTINKTITFFSNNIFKEIINSTLTREKIVEIEKIVEKEIFSNQIKYGNKSFIRILNKEKNQILNKLEFEIFKGNDTTKRTIYFKLNNKEILKIQNLKKFDYRKGVLNLNLIKENNTILIEGLNKKIETEFKKIEILKTKKQKQFLEIIDLQIDELNLKFKINTNLKSLEGKCYIRYGKKKVSNDFKLKNQKNQKGVLKLKFSKIVEIDKDKIPLIFYCKYKKINLKTFKYKKLNFIISPDFLIQKLNLTKNNSLLNLENFSIKLIKTINSKNEIKQNKTLKIKQNNKTDNENKLSGFYLTKNSKNKEISIIFFLTFLSILSITLVIKR